MNKEAFLKSLKRHAKKMQWEFNVTALRTKAPNCLYFCPITFLHYVRNGKHVATTQAFDVAKKELNMAESLSLEIIKAADSYGSYDHRLRARMIKIVGLKD